MISFEPFKKADVEKMLAKMPSPKGEVKSYRIKNWYNTDTREVLDGLQCKSKSTGKWHNVSYGNRAVVFDDTKLAEKTCKQMNALLK